MFGKRILIAVPHPDDEVVACCAAIGRAQAEGAEIFALYLTHGCIAREVRWPWERRLHETLVVLRRVEAKVAAKFLGITPINLENKLWPERPARHLWRELPKVCDELHAAIAQHAIDQLWVPAYEGGNADHDGLNAVGSLFVQALEMSHRNSSPLEGGGIPPVLEFAEYNFFGGKARSQEFPYPNGTEQILTLTSEERAKKIAALEIYKSERMNLDYVKDERECFRPLAAYDYAKPPHPGTLWYARFQWVPFRHPRVDFSRPDAVSDAIVRFTKTQL